MHVMHFYHDRQTVRRDNIRLVALCHYLLVECVIADTHFRSMFYDASMAG